MKWPDIELEENEAVVLPTVIGEIVETEKEVRKRNRREKRRRSQENMMTRIQQAESPQHILECLIAIENAIPLTYTLEYNKLSMPTKAATSASVAIRLYSLDRSLRYEDIPYMENLGTSVHSKASSRAKTNFFTRCMLSPVCSGYIGHQGKCNTSFEFTTRCPEVNDSVVQTYNFAAAMAAMSRPSAGGVTDNTAVVRPGLGQGYQQQQQQFGRSSSSSSSSFGGRNFKNGRSYGEEESEFLYERLSKKEKLEIDVDFVMPFIPRSDQITEYEWI